MSKFKVGDKVRCVSVSTAVGVHVGKIYTVKGYDSLCKTHGCVLLVEVDNVSPFEECFELAQEDTTTIQATAKRKDYDLFTPDCLVGVETDRGYIDAARCVYVFPKDLKPIIFVHTTKSLYFTDAYTLKYYISDESDETVSFTEYVNMFYDGWHNKYYEFDK